MRAIAVAITLAAVCAAGARPSAALPVPIERGALPEGASRDERGVTSLSFSAPRFGPLPVVELGADAPEATVKSAAVLSAEYAHSAADELFSASGGLRVSASAPHHAIAEPPLAALALLPLAALSLRRKRAPEA
ncbi:MAG: hypothetical protein ACHQ6T_18625 [Myxococcota bacterium]